MAETAELDERLLTSESRAFAHELFARFPALRRHAAMERQQGREAWQLTLEIAAPSDDPRPMTTEAAVVRFLHRFEEVALCEDFDLLEDMIDEHAYFRFNDGDFVGRAAVRAAFEKTWRADPTVVKAGFYLSDIVVLTTDVASATATYTYTWEGAHGDRKFRIQGRGTRVLAFDGAEFRIVHEHLSGSPRGA